MTAHQCQPDRSIEPFCYFCRTCGQEIEPVFCRNCEGNGHEYGSPHTMRPCGKCSGTGVVAWKPVEEGGK